MKLNGKYYTYRELRDALNELSKEAWNSLIKNHIKPSRLFRLAFRLEMLTENDRQHLNKCLLCAKGYTRYKEIYREIEG